MKSSSGFLEARLLALFLRKTGPTSTGIGILLGFAVSCPSVASPDTIPISLTVPVEIMFSKRSWLLLDGVDADP